MPIGLTPTFRPSLTSNQAEEVVTLGGRRVEITLTGIEQRTGRSGQRVRSRSRSTTDHDDRPVRQEFGSMGMGRDSAVCDAEPGRWPSPLTHVFERIFRTAHAAERTSACSSTVRVAFSCLSGG